jgi:diaminopimelate decarboxylase
MESKFGIAMHGVRHFAAAEAASRASSLNLLGFHCHIGSQIFDTSPFLAAARIMLVFAAELREKTGIVARELDLGGGLGVVYTGEAPGPSPSAYIAELGREVRRLAEERAFPLPRLFVEPGRSIVAEAGVMLYTVGSVKELPNGTTVAAVDGGMSDNPRPMLYGAKYRAVMVLPAEEAGKRPVRIVGKHCEEGDTLIEQADLPPLRPGDLLAVLVSGAYQYAMRSSYNALPCPAVVHVAGKRDFTVVERQTYRDLIAKQRVLPASKRESRDRAANAF